MSDWPKLQNSLAFPDSMGTFGTSVTGGGSPNTKGSWVEMIASLPYDICAIIFTLQNHPAGYQLMDVGIGNAGGGTPTDIIIPNITVSQALSGTHADCSFWWPIAVRAGERLALRSQSSAGSGFLTGKGHFLADGFAGIQAPERYEDWGTDLTGSRGTQFTTGNGSKGSWTAIKTSTPFDTRWISIEIQGETSPVDMAIDIGVGGAGNEVVVFPDIHYTVESLAIMIGPFPFTFPAGTRISVRGRAGGQTCRAMLHGGA